MSWHRVGNDTGYGQYITYEAQFSEARKRQYMMPLPIHATFQRWSKARWTSYEEEDWITHSDHNKKEIRLIERYGLSVFGQGYILPKKL